MNGVINESNSTVLQFFLILNPLARTDVGTEQYTVAVILYDATFQTVILLLLVELSCIESVSILSELNASVVNPLPQFWFTEWYTEQTRFELPLPFEAAVILPLLSTVKLVAV